LKNYTLDYSKIENKIQQSTELSIGQIWNIAPIEEQLRQI